MEKIININLGGRVIAIEDAAYNSLKEYFESLRGYFRDEDSREEIINDIESRVAELMEAKLRRGAPAITTTDVEEIIASIGRVEDFAAEEEGPQPGPQAAPQPKKTKRFFRDSNDKILGGVCSGLAAYLEVDPALIRIVFAILALGGWGFGIMLYILLWIFVPTQALEGYRGKRLFRNTEDKWLGGVASGIAAYFGMQTWVLRLLFLLPILISVFAGGSWWLLGFGSFFFGSISGTFVLIYIVLWVVLPAARSQFEKMEMRGEKVDLNAIRQNINSNTEELRGRVKNWSEEVGHSAKQFMDTRGKAFGREVREAAHTATSRGGSVLGSIIRAIGMILGIFIAFLLFITLVGYSFGGFSKLVNDYLLQSPKLRLLGWCSVLLLLGIPLVALVISMVRHALHLRRRHRAISVVLMVLWLAGCVCGLTLAGSLVKEFMQAGSVTTETPILQPHNRKLTLRVPGTPLVYSNSLPWLQGDIQGWDLRGDTMLSASIRVQPSLSPDSLYHVHILRFSRGRNTKEAEARAEGIEYALWNQPGNDSVLELANHFAISKQNGFRNQQVLVRIQVPAGARIRFDGSLAENLNDVHSFYDFQKSGFSYSKWRLLMDEDYQDLNWEDNLDYIMSSDGRLVNSQNLQDTLETTTHSIHRNYGPGNWRAEYRASSRESDFLEHRKDRREDSIDLEIEKLKSKIEVLKNQNQ